jgi:beta-N-acetylhexosaminidase
MTKKVLWICLSIFGMLFSNNLSDHRETLVYEKVFHALSLKEKIAQMLMVYMPHEEYIVEHQFGAVLVMKPHLKDTIAFKKTIRNTNTRLKIPLFVAIDQEGGFVNRLASIDSKWKSLPSAYEMRLWNLEKIDSVAIQTAIALKNLGINLNLAPVLDPATDFKGKKTFMEVSKRSWGDLDSNSYLKPQQFVKSLSKHGVASVSKHFPGYDSWTNSDHQISLSISPTEQIQKNIQVFELLGTDIPFIMMSSVRFSKISIAPAVFDSNLVSKAKKINPEAVILTDDLWGASLRSWISGKKSVQKNYPKADFERLIIKSIDAGNDMLMITYPAKAVEIIEFLENLAQKDARYKQKLEDSAYKILKAKYRLGVWKDGLD